jgi:ATP-dependent DNA helicase RecG
MNNSELIALVDRLRREPNEAEWLEFKRNRYQSQEIGEYLSALANGACLAGKQRGYLLFGIDDKSHEVVGTSFDPYTEKGKGNQDLLPWIGAGLRPNIGYNVYLVKHASGRVVLFEVGPAWDRPVRFYGKAYIRVGSSKTELSKYPQKERAIWLRRTDWSALVCERADLTDLDSEALLKARNQFKVKHPAQAKSLDSWDDATFLNKAKLTIHGGVTHAAILLLGKPESSGLLSPAVARISWILEDANNHELDYEHFGSPFILQVDHVLRRIRNLTLRALPSGTLFPQEISQYDPWVIREALHNCIAHQDYGLHGRISVVETPISILLANAGSFIPGTVESVIRQNAPMEIYRNPFLAEAMVNLNMIDTQGGGIKRMFRLQVGRFFPLPTYDLSEPERVVVTLNGEILDEQYTRLLMERTDLDLWQVMLLDKIQKRVPISREEHRQLKGAKLVEGRYPNLFIIGRIAEVVGDSARHIRNRGFDKKYYLDLILALVREHGPVDRPEINRLLLDKLPEVMTEKQKKVKVHNLLSELARKGQIRNIGGRRYSRWQAADGSINQTKDKGP